MRGFPSNSCFVIALVYISSVCVKSQDFCESYRKNNHSLIVYSQSSDTIMLIVNRHFWRLREKSSQLVFDRQDFQASNSSEQWTEGECHSCPYHHANPVYNETDVNYRGIVLFQESGETHEEDVLFNEYLYQFYENYFKYVDYKYVSVGSLNISRFVFTIFDQQLNVEIQQSKVEGSDYYEIDYRYQKLEASKIFLFDIGYGKDRERLDSNNTKIAAQLKRLVSDFKSNIPIVGAYLNSHKEVILFLRLEHDIIYCASDECLRKKYRVLISCQTKYVYKVWIFVVITVVIVGMFLIIGAIFYWFFHRNRKTQSTQMYDSRTHEIGTIATLDSVTGLRKEKSKTEMFMKLESISSSSVSENSNPKAKQVLSPKSRELGKPKTDPKKSSPKKMPNTSKTVKAKVEPNPKKSPKPKK